jgi:glucose uptake protein GlcU
MAIAFIAFALVMAGVAMEAAKDNQNAEATEVLRQVSYWLDLAARLW